jgi:hypothetical protein
MPSLDERGEALGTNTLEHAQDLQARSGEPGLGAGVDRAEDLCRYRPGTAPVPPSSPGTGSPAEKRRRGGVTGDDRVGGQGEGAECQLRSLGRFAPGAGFARASPTTRGSTLRACRSRKRRALRHRGAGVSQDVRPVWKGVRDLPPVRSRPTLLHGRVRSGRAHGAGLALPRRPAGDVPGKASSRRSERSVETQEIGTERDGSSSARGRRLDRR